MKPTILLLFSIIWIVSAQGQTKPLKASLDTLPILDLPDINQSAFGEGEYLRFRLHYGLIDAGEAELSIYKAQKKFAGRDALHVVGKGRTLGMFNWFFKVKDRYETYLDEEGIFPWEFIRDIKEGGYEKFQTYRFHQDKAAVTTNKGDTFKIPPLSQDMLSSFYFARTLDFSQAKPGDVYTIPTFVDDEQYPLMIKYLGREKLKTRTGTYRCMKFVPVVQEGRIFEEEEDMTVWITDDKNRIPVLAKAKVLVGSIKMELVEYQNLSNPIAKVD
ncbi:MAG: DUF3108 domain-containing protein [Flavobacteriales bacterium]|nr:DUF3108 domain-containing protein [Flavobacteriales bacterium]